MNVEIEIIKDIPTDKINKYVDLTVYGMARNTLDYTLADSRFPFKTGNLQNRSMAQGAKKESKNTYVLGAEGVDYAEYVWEFPQNINWTNPDTYAQWYITEFKDKKELIIHNAVNNAIRSVK